MIRRTGNNIIELFDINRYEDVLIITGERGQVCFDAPELDELINLLDTAGLLPVSERNPILFRKFELDKSEIPF